MMFIRVGILVITVLYYPENTIRTIAYGQLVISTFLVVSYWLYFHFEFKKKQEALKNRELHKGNPLIDLPFNSVVDFLPSNLSSFSQVAIVIVKFLSVFVKQFLIFCRPLTKDSLTLHGDFLSRLNVLERSSFPRAVRRYFLQ